MISTKSYILGKFFIFPIVKFLKPFRNGLEPMDSNPFIEGECGQTLSIRIRILFFLTVYRVMNLVQNGVVEVKEIFIEQTKTKRTLI